MSHPLRLSSARVSLTRWKESQGPLRGGRSRNSEKRAIAVGISNVFDDFDIAVTDGKGFYPGSADHLYEKDDAIPIGDLRYYIHNIVRIFLFYQIPRPPGDFFPRVPGEGVAVAAAAVEICLTVPGLPHKRNHVAVYGLEPVFSVIDGGEEFVEMPVGPGVDLVERNIT